MNIFEWFLFYVLCLNAAFMLIFQNAAVEKFRKKKLR